MNIEIVTLRDPDSSTEVKVFIDGREAQFTQYTIDPGSGWTRRDWNEHRAHCLNQATSRDVRNALDDAFDACKLSIYIDD